MTIPITYVGPHAGVTDPRLTASAIILDTDYTGSTDASSDLQAACDEGSATGRPVVMLPGILRIGTPVRPDSGLRLIGSGVGNTILKPVGNISAIRRTNEAVFTDVSFEHFEVDGSLQTGPADSHKKAFYFTNARRVFMNNLYVHDTGSTGIGIDFITGVIQNCWVVNCGRLGTTETPGCSGIGIGNGNLDANWEPLTISNCHVEGNKRYGIFIESQKLVKPRGFTVVGCTSRNNLDGFGDCGATGTRWIGNHAHGNTRSGFAIDTGTFSAGITSRRTSINGCISTNNGVGLIVRGEGIRDVFSEVRVDGSTFMANTSHGIDIELTTDAASSDVVLMGNTISENGGRGLRVAGTVTLDALTIQHNRFANNTTSDVLIEAPTTGLILTGNDIRSGGATITVTPTTPGTTTGNFGTVTEP